MKNDYKPPFDITEEMLTLVSSILKNVSYLSNEYHDVLVRLRRVNRLRSLNSSLKIEQNSLSLSEATALIEGKVVVGPIEDITATLNANAAYKLINKIDPYNLNDVLKIHGIMMKDLIEDAGKLRKDRVGVFDERGILVHLAPPAELVESHLKNLFSFLVESPLSVLIKSSIFHYEFEFIHPFDDGNGRLGRYLQSAMLIDFMPVFSVISVESLISENQSAYYAAIHKSTKEGKSTEFILFMLKMINLSVEETLSDVNKFHISYNKYINSLLKVVTNQPMSREEIMKKLKLKSRSTFYKNYLKPALDLGLIVMTIPNNKNSRDQRYYRPIGLTD